MRDRHVKRRRILMDSFQYRLLAFNLLYFATILMITAAMIFVPMMMKLQNPAVPMAERQQAAELLLSLHAWFWPVLAVVFVLLAVHSVFVSHRIAGALYRFQMVFGEIADGNLTVRATLRKNDYLTKEAGALGDMVSALRERIAALQAHSATLPAALDELQSAAKLGETDRVRQAASRVGMDVRSLHDELFRFCVDDEHSRGAPGRNGRDDALMDPPPPDRASAVSS